MDKKYFSNYFLGLFLADGNFHNGRVELNSKNVELLKDIQSDSEFNFKISIRNQETSRIRTSNPFVKTFLKHHGVTEGSKHSNLPYPEKLNERYFYSFLAGYFDGDGSISISKDNEIGVQFTSNSKKFLEEIRNKLNTKLGIEGSFYEYKENNGYKLRFFQAESKLILEKIEKFVRKDKDKIKESLEKLNLDKTKWTDKEEFYLKNNFNEIKNEKIASHLDRTVDSVKSKATRMKLR